MRIRALFVRLVAPFFILPLVAFADWDEIPVETFADVLDREKSFELIVILRANVKKECVAVVKPLDADEKLVHRKELSIDGMGFDSCSWTLPESVSKQLEVCYLSGMKELLPAGPVGADQRRSRIVTSRYDTERERWMFVVELGPKGQSNEYLYVCKWKK